MRIGEPTQSAKDGIRETEAQKEEWAVAVRLLFSACLGERKEKGCAQMLPAPFPGHMGPFPVHLTACSPCSGQAQGSWTQEDGAWSSVLAFLSWRS